MRFPQGNHKVPEYKRESHTERHTEHTQAQMCMHCQVPTVRGLLRRWPLRTHPWPPSQTLGHPGFPDTKGQQMPRVAGSGGPCTCLTTGTGMPSP